MRKIFFLLCSFLLLFHPSASLAESLTLYQYDDATAPLPYQTRPRSLSFSQVLTISDTFYLLAYDNSARELVLYSYHPGDAELTLCASHFFRAQWVCTMQEAQEICEENMSCVPLYQMPDLRYAISGMGTDGEKLYAINHLNGLIFTLEMTEEGVQCEDVVQMDVGDWFYREYSQEGDEGGIELCVPEVLGVSGGKMACFCVGATQDDLLLISLTDGSVERIALGDGWCEAIPGAPGEALISVWPKLQKESDEKGVLLYRFDIADGTMTCLTEDATYQLLSGVTWDAEEEAYLVMNGLEIRSTKDFVHYTTRGSLPQTGMELALIGDSLIAYRSSTVYLRTLGEAAQESLTLVVRNSDGAYDAIQQFSEAHVQVMLDVQNKHYGTKEELVSALESGTVDLLLIGEDAREDKAWVLDELLDSGCCRELSDMPEVVAYMERVHPVFRSAVMRGDKIYGIVRWASSTSGYYINREVQEEMHLMEDEYPTNLVELCAFITKWNNEYVTQYPACVPLEATEDYHQRMLKLMVWEWIGYCQANEMALTFEHPIFREMLTALEAMDASAIEKANQVVNEDDSEYRRALIWTGVYTVGDFSNYTTASGDRTLIPMTLTAETPFLHAVTDFEVTLVGAGTNHADLAEELLSQMIETMPEIEQHVLLADCTEGVERSNYSSQATTYESSIAALKRQMEKAPASRKLNFADQIAHLEAEYHYLNGQIRWRIAPKTIELYQQVILPACYLRRPAGVEYGDAGKAFQLLCEAYLAGELTQDAFIEKANELVQM